MSDNVPSQRVADNERFDAWLKENNHHLGAGRWSIYTLCKAAYRAASKYERKQAAREIENLNSVISNLNTTILEAERIIWDARDGKDFKEKLQNYTDKYHQ